MVAGLSRLWLLYIYIYVVPFDKALYLHCLGLQGCIWLWLTLIFHPGEVNDSHPLKTKLDVVLKAEIRNGTVRRVFFNHMFTRIQTQNINVS